MRWGFRAIVVCLVACDVGWQGKVISTPTAGDPGCDTAPAGTLTPGLCRGGAASAGNEIGAFDMAYGVASDTDGNIFIGDSHNARVVRVLARPR